MATRYEITGEFLRLYQMATECDLTQSDIADTLEGLEMEFDEKADAYAKVRFQLQGDALVVKSEIDRLTKRLKTINNNVRQIDCNLEEAMRATNRRKFKTKLFSFSVQKNPARLILDDPAKVPDRFLIPQEPKVDSAGIKAAMKDGEEFGWAHLEQGESLRIR